MADPYGYTASGGMGVSLPPPPGSKRNRRMRSVQGQLGGGDQKKGRGAAAKDQEFLELERSGAPPFLIKTYQMISTCDMDLAEWSEDGETFVVKNTSKFAKMEIPKYFDHSNFSSFSRQLNFYGFKKVPNKTIRIDQQDKSSANHVRFYNDKFKRGRTDLLSKIQRSTKNSGNSQNQAQEIKFLKDKVSTLESQVSDMSYSIKTLQQQIRELLNAGVGASPMKPDSSLSQPQDYQHSTVSNTDMNDIQPSQDVYRANNSGYNDQPNDDYEPLQYTAPVPISGSGPTLAPHPNTKQIDPNLLPPPPMDPTTNRNASLLRGLSGAFDESLFTEGPDRVQSSTIDLNQGNMMARIQSLDISGVYNSNNYSKDLPPVDDEYSGMTGKAV